MAGINGSVEWGIVPLNWDGTELATMAHNYRSNYLVSANNPIRYQIIWNSGSMSEDKEPSPLNYSGSNGDVVNVIFDIYATTDFPSPISVNDWDLLASIKKSRDISNKHYLAGTGKLGHRFTIDISQICQDSLSYSLVPIGKGTWQDFRFGGMNGGLTMQDNVTETISNYNVSKNGTFRNIRVNARFEILKGDSAITTSTYTKPSPPDVRIINSVPQFDRDNTYNIDYYIRRWTSNNSDKKKSFLTKQPYLSHTGLVSDVGHKSVRENEEAEWLYWYQAETRYGASTAADSLLGKYSLQVYIPNQTTVYLHEFSNTLDKGTNNGVLDTFNRTQNRICVQNVSVSYINANNGTTYTNAKTEDGSDILVATFPNGLVNSTYRDYRVYIYGRRATDYNLNYRFSGMMWYRLDVEAEHPYGYVRFHWLNRLGGIDSYTAKRDVVEGLSVSRSTVERKQGDRTWNQNQYSTNGGVLQGVTYRSNTMRGGDIYKGGVEVMSVSANRNYSVYTDPLNRSTAEWLEEIMTSPNVWVEFETDATRHLNDVNPYQRPSTKEYMPVIITNSDIETVNQEQGLVKFNIEYTLSHKINTQRN
tara:strand:- start:47 stop:1813 length:1767 start_codon:yes stop_codon:yes gene_type:complete